MISSPEASIARVAGDDEFLHLVQDDRRTARPFALASLVGVPVEGEAGRIGQRALHQPMDLGLAGDDEAMPPV